MKDIVRAVALAAALGLSMLPLGALAAAPQQYTVAFTPTVGIESGSPFTALMKLTVSDDGIISGYYHLDGDPVLTPVTGGQDSNHNAWLRIGGRVGLRFQGVVSSGTFTGTAFGPDNAQYSFTATPVQQ